MKIDGQPSLNDSCGCWRRLPPKERSYVVKMLMFTLFFIAATVLVNTAHPDDGDSGKTRFWVGVGLFFVGVAAVWGTTTLFMHSLLQAIQKKSNTAEDLSYIRASMMYYPIYVTGVYVMFAYSLFLVFRLDLWNLAMGSALLLVALVFVLMMLFSSGRNVMQLARTYFSDAFKSLSDQTPSKVYNANGGESKVTRTTNNAKFAINKTRQ
jgi:cation transport ATPase